MFLGFLEIFGFTDYQVKVQLESKAIGLMICAEFTL
jgi:hypothetical protein